MQKSTDISALELVLPVGRTFRTTAVDRAQNDVCVSNNHEKLNFLQFYNLLCFRK